MGECRKQRVTELVVVNLHYIQINQRYITGNYYLSITINK